MLHWFPRNLPCRKAAAEIAAFHKSDSRNPESYPNLWPYHQYIYTREDFPLLHISQGIALPWRASQIRFSSEWNRYLGFARVYFYFYLFGITSLLWVAPLEIPLFVEPFASTYQCDKNEPLLPDGDDDESGRKTLELWSHLSSAR